MPKVIYTIAESVKESPRFASIQDPAQLEGLLKTRYSSELEAWLKQVPTTSWKYTMLQQERQIRALQRRIQELEAELW